MRVRQWTWSSILFYKSEISGGLNLKLISTHLMGEMCERPFSHIITGSQGDDLNQRGIKVSHHLECLVIIHNRHEIKATS